MSELDFARFSFNQLVLLQYFLQSPDRLLTVSQMEKHTVLSGKSLGGVISALARTKYKETPIIVPMGRAREGVGLRWRLNKELFDVASARQEIRRLLVSYA